MKMPRSVVLLSCLLLAFGQLSCQRLLLAVAGFSEIQSHEKRESHRRLETSLNKLKCPYTVVYDTLFELELREMYAGGTRQHFSVSNYFGPTVYTEAGHVVVPDTNTYRTCAGQPHQVFTKLQVPVASLPIDSSEKELLLRSRHWQTLSGEAVQLPKADYYVVYRAADWSRRFTRKMVKKTLPALAGEQVGFIFVNHSYYQLD